MKFSTSKLRKSSPWTKHSPDGPPLIHKTMVQIPIFFWIKKNIQKLFMIQTYSNPHFSYVNQGPFTISAPVAHPSRGDLLQELPQQRQRSAVRSAGPPGMDPEAWHDKVRKLPCHWIIQGGAPPVMWMLVMLGIIPMKTIDGSPDHQP